MLFFPSVSFFHFPCGTHFKEFLQTTGDNNQLLFTVYRSKKTCFHFIFGKSG